MVNLHGFSIIKSRKIPEINNEATLFRHEKTDTRLLSLRNDDENKVFGINFRTPAPDSSGLTHILEHSVLCGSRKYPVKEPFIELVKGSLKTFLNAFTFPDKTCYPVASQNLKDFYNLIDVYLDAVFYPRLTKEIFMQEGWHYELDDIQSSMTFKGVVLNEMKGAYSSPDHLLSTKGQQLIFPDTAYVYDSGGDPESIIGLDYDGFVAYYKKYYHPSNALIFFYGDDPEEERLRLLDHVLSDFSRQTIEAGIAVQPHRKYPGNYKVIVPYSVTGNDADKNKTYTTINWLLPGVGDIEMQMSLEVLTHILLGTPASPLRKRLIDSKLGEDIAGYGLQSHFRQMMFSGGLKGMAAENVDRVVELIDNVLKDLVKNGIDGDTIAASMNTMEFLLRENNTGAYPRGLVIMLRALTNWVYDLDPMGVIAFEAPLNHLKQRIENGEKVFEELISQYLVENEHRVTLVLKPDATLAGHIKTKEEEYLEKVRNSVDDKELLQIIHLTKTLKTRQETPDTAEDLAKIPSISIGDLDRNIRIIPEQWLGEGNMMNHPGNILLHDLFTNGILYLDIGFDLHVLPQAFLSYVPLFGRCLIEMGTKSQDYIQLTQRIGRYTGGIQPTRVLSAKITDPQGVACFILRGKATLENCSHLLSILEDILVNVHVNDKDRFKQIALEAKSHMEAAVVSSGHHFIHNRINGRFNVADWAVEQMGGISYLYFLRDLIDHFEERWPEIQKTMQSIQAMLIKRRTMLCNVTLDGKHWESIQHTLEDFLRHLPENPQTIKEWKFSPVTGNEGFTIPSQVNYVGMGGNIYQLGYSYRGTAAVITRYLRSTWLWEKIRMQGGAYGAFCSFDRYSGVLIFSSYRDPNILKSLENFKRSSNFLRELEITDEELNRAIIGVIGDWDTYQLADAKGFTSLVRQLVGINDEERQKQRDEAFATSKEDFHHFGDILEKLSKKSEIVILGPEDRLSNEEGISALNLKVERAL